MLLAFSTGKVFERGGGGGCHQFNVFLVVIHSKSFNKLKIICEQVRLQMKKER